MINIFSRHNIVSLKEQGGCQSVNLPERGLLQARSQSRSVLLELFPLQAFWGSGLEGTALSFLWMRGDDILWPINKMLFLTSLFHTVKRQWLCFRGFPSFRIFKRQLIWVEITGSPSMIVLSMLVDRTRAVRQWYIHKHDQPENFYTTKVWESLKGRTPGRVVERSTEHVSEVFS